MLNPTTPTKQTSSTTTAYSYNSLSLSASKSSPSKKFANYIGDRFIPFRNAEKWDIQFNSNDVKIINRIEKKMSKN
jgi:hypothetical protein